MQEAGADALKTTRASNKDIFYIVAEYNPFLLPTLIEVVPQEDLINREKRGYPAPMMKSLFHIFIESGSSFSEKEFKNIFTKWIDAGVDVTKGTSILFWAAKTDPKVGVWVLEVIPKEHISKLLWGDIPYSLLEKWGEKIPDMFRKAYRGGKLINKSGIGYSIL